MAKHRKLTSEEREKIVGIYRAGLVTNIALLTRKFNVNKTTISRILRKCGIRPPLRQHLWKVTVVIPKEGWKISYLAGLLDGDGYVGIVNNKRKDRSPTPRIAIYNTSLSLMKWLIINFGGQYRLRKDQTNAKVDKYIRKRPQYKWEIERVLDILRILNAITPYLIVKNSEAKEVLMYCEERVLNLYGSEFLASYM